MLRSSIQIYEGGKQTLFLLKRQGCVNKNTVDEEENHRAFGGCLPVVPLQPYVHVLNQRGDSLSKSHEQSDIKICLRGRGNRLPLNTHVGCSFLTIGGHQLCVEL